jgi:hypothetical protein
VKLRVYSASVGECSRSLDSKKNGRFSGRYSAKSVLPLSWGTSSATCEKSGLSVPSTTSSGEARHFTSRLPCTPLAACVGSPGSASLVWRAVMLGRTVRKLFCCGSSMPCSGCIAEMNDGESVGTGTDVHR